MYEHFYGFMEKPFRIVPNPKYLYLSPKHKNALTHLEYGLMERIGFILLTGEVGTGKTTLIRYLLDRLEPDIEAAVLFNTNLPADQFLELVLGEFGVKVEDSTKIRMLDAFYKFLIDRFAEGKRVLLIIDEAQNLSDEALEEVRMLSNLQSEDQMLLQIMLVGHPELKSKLQKPALQQLAQRIAVNYHLTALGREDTGNYIAFRLEKAGGKPDLFTKAAIDIIFDVSKGIPRSINLLCDASLAYGFADDLSIIDEATVQQVIEDKGDFHFQKQEVHKKERLPLSIEERLLKIEENIQKISLILKHLIEGRRFLNENALLEKLNLVAAALKKEKAKNRSIIKALESKVRKVPQAPPAPVIEKKAAHKVSISEDLVFPSDDRNFSI